MSNAEPGEITPIPDAMLPLAFPNLEIHVEWAQPRLVDEAGGKTSQVRSGSLYIHKETTTHTIATILDLSHQIPPIALYRLPLFVNEIRLISCLGGIVTGGPAPLSEDPIADTVTVQFYSAARKFHGTITRVLDMATCAASPDLRRPERHPTLELTPFILVYKEFRQWTHMELFLKKVSCSFPSVLP
jgi:hypothetical protein